MTTNLQDTLSQKEVKNIWRLYGYFPEGITFGALGLSYLLSLFFAEAVAGYFPIRWKLTLPAITTFIIFIAGFHIMTMSNAPQVFQIETVAILIAVVIAIAYQTSIIERRIWKRLASK